MGMHKNSLEMLTFVICGYLGGIAPGHTFLENFSRPKFVLQIVCLYLEPLKSNKASKLTICTQNAALLPHLEKCFKTNKQTRCLRRAPRCFTVLSVKPGCRRELHSDSDCRQAGNEQA